MDADASGKTVPRHCAVSPNEFAGRRIKVPACSIFLIKEKNKHIIAPSYRFDCGPIRRSYRQPSSLPDAWFRPILFLPILRGYFSAAGL